MLADFLVFWRAIGSFTVKYDVVYHTSILSNVLEPVSPCAANLINVGPLLQEVHIPIIVAEQLDGVNEFQQTPHSAMPSSLRPHVPLVAKGTLVLGRAKLANSM